MRPKINKTLDEKMKKNVERRKKRRCRAVSLSKKDHSIRYTNHKRRQKPVRVEAQRWLGDKTLGIMDSDEWKRGY